MAVAPVTDPGPTLKTDEPAPKALPAVQNQIINPQNPKANAHRGAKTQLYRLDINLISFRK